MKKINFTAILLVIATMQVMAQRPSIGGYTVYYGSLHNHTSYSDGSGTPSGAYTYAKNTAGLDFFSLADHSNYLTATEWSDIKAQANANNQDGVFTTFYGFEWTATTNYGDIAVINVDDYCVYNGGVNTPAALNTWIEARPSCVAFFNHPSYYNSNGTEFLHFNYTPSNQIVGIEQWNKLNNFSTYYYNDGYDLGDGKNYFEEANSKGWKVGACGAGDDHNATWGTAQPYRMAILANNLTRSDLLAAMQARRFYSTLDKNIALSFKVNNQEMGSTIPGGTYTFQVQASDANAEVYTEVIIYGKNHNVVASWTPNTTNVNVSTTLNAFDGEFFYVKIKQADGDEAISSPVFISGGATNQNPVCAITSPLNGTMYPNNPTTVVIDATATDDGSISKVEFYAGTTKLGEDLTSPYSYTWSDVPSGCYALTVKAFDNYGTTSTSTPVTINVQIGPVIPPTAWTLKYVDCQETAAENGAAINAFDGNISTFWHTQYSNLQPPFPHEIQINLGSSYALNGFGYVPRQNSSNTRMKDMEFYVSVDGTNWTLVKTVVGTNDAIEKTYTFSTITARYIRLRGLNACNATNYGGAAEIKAYGTLVASAPVADFNASATAINVGQSVLFTDMSTESPTSWNWSFSGGAPATSTAQNPTVTYSTAGTYTVVLTATNAAGNNTKTKTNYITVTAAPTYCSVQSSNFSSDYIKTVTVGSFTKTTTGSTYSNYTTNVVPLSLGASTSYTLTPNANKRVEYWNVYIDYNHDGDFTDANELVISVNGKGARTGSFNVLSTAPTGQTRMRVMMKYNAALTGPCDAFTYGEVEDYTVNISGYKANIKGSKSESTESIKQGVAVYSNKNVLFVNTGSEETLGKVMVYNIQGKLIANENISVGLNSITLNAQPGIYIANVQINSKVIIRKFIVK